MQTEYTRTDYQKGLCDHWTYNAQFTSPEMINYIKMVVGEDVIKKSTDKYFNDIPLKNWDLLHIKQFLDIEKFKRLNNTTYPPGQRHLFIWGPSDNVSIAKSCARIIRGW